MKPKLEMVEEGLSNREEERLAELLDEYVAALERGESPTINDLAEGCPELAEVLPEYLEGVRLIHDAMAGGSDKDHAEAAHLPTVTTGDKQLGDYELIREVGRGGMGVVYEARQASLNRRVAVKVLPFAAVLDERQIARFRTEAQAAAALHHPNIVPVYAVGQERGVHFYAMQYVDGQSLGQAIEELRQSEASPAATDQPGATQGGGQATTVNLKQAATPQSTPFSSSLSSPLSTVGTIRESSFFRAVAQLGVQAAEALDHAHQYGVVHRDIKPTNLLIDHNSKLWVTDFGLARIQTEMSVTQTGDVVGTLRYMSPEQAQGRGDLVDGRTDVYSLGATLYEMLTLQPAHGGIDAHAITQRIESVDPPPLRRHNPAIPVDLETIVLRAMERSRDDRYESAQELGDDLQRFLDGRPTVARRPNLFERGGRWLTRHRGLAAGVAATLVAITLVSVASAVWIAAAGRQTEAALAKAQANLALAQSHYRQARSAVDHFGGNVADRLAELPGSDRLRHELLSDTLAYYQEFLKTAGRDADLRSDLAATHFKSGVIAHRLGDLEGARYSYQQAITSCRAAPGLSLDQEALPVDSASLLALGLCSLARVDSEAGDYDSAMQHFDEAVAILRTYADNTPKQAKPLSLLAEALANQAVARRGTDDIATGAKELREAIEFFNQALQLSPGDTDRRALAVAHSNLSDLLRDHSPEEAYQSSQQAVEVLVRLAAERPEQTSCRADLAMAYNNLAALEGVRGDWRSAADGYQLAADEIERLVRLDPLLPRSRRELAVTHSNLALALSRLGEHEASDAAFAKAAATIEALIEDFPTQPAYATSLAALWNNRGVALQTAGRQQQAIEAFASAVDHHRKSGMGNASAQSAAKKSYENYATALLNAGRQHEAAAVRQEQHELLTTATSKSKTLPPMAPLAH